MTWVRFLQENYFLFRIHQLINFKLNSNSFKLNVCYSFIPHLETQLSQKFKGTKILQRINLHFKIFINFHLICIYNIYPNCLNFWIHKSFKTFAKNCNMRLSYVENIFLIFSTEKQREKKLIKSFSFSHVIQTMKQSLKWVSEMDREMCNILVRAYFWMINKSNLFL